MIRIGLLVPSSNTVFENDVHASLPRSQFTAHAARMHLVETTRDAEQVMLDHHAPAAASDLSALEPDLVLFGCTSAGSLGGMDHDREICEALGRRAAAPCVGVLSAVSEALVRRNWKRVVVVTPYVDELTSTIAASLAQAGITVLAAGGMGITNNIALADPEPDEIVEFAMSVAGRHRPDGMFVSCTNFRALEARPALEKALGLPVLTSNLAAIEAVTQRFPANATSPRPRPSRTYGAGPVAAAVAAE
jgi:maleate isomerase